MLLAVGVIFFFACSHHWPDKNERSPLNGGRAQLSGRTVGAWLPLGRRDPQFATATSRQLRITTHCTGTAVHCCTYLHMDFNGWLHITPKHKSWGNP